MLAVSNKPLVVKLCAHTFDAGFAYWPRSGAAQAPRLSGFGASGNAYRWRFHGNDWDPSGRQKTRPMLSLEEVAKNGETYVEQVSRILDRETMKSALQFDVA